MYAAVAQEEHAVGKRHVAAMESDAGGFVPRGVRMDANDSGVELVRSWAQTLEPYNLHYFGRGGAGVDIGPLKSLEPRPLLRAWFQTANVISTFITAAKTFGKTSTNVSSNWVQPHAQPCWRCWTSTSRRALKKGLTLLPQTSRAQTENRRTPRGCRHRLGSDAQFIETPLGRERQANVVVGVVP